jgi:hypothetical protein
MVAFESMANYGGALRSMGIYSWSCPALLLIKEMLLLYAAGIINGIRF